MRIIDRVDELLKEKGLTAKELAVAIGVSSGNISDWRSGKAKPSTEAVAKMAVYLGVTTDYLHGLSESRYSSEIAAASGIDYSDLSPEDRAKIEDYIALLRLKHDKK